MWEKWSSFKSITVSTWERKHISAPLFVLFLLPSHRRPFHNMLYRWHVLPVIALHNDPLKCDRQVTIVPKSATKNCEIPSVWGLLSANHLSFRCVLDPYDARFYATQEAQRCKCEENMALWGMSLKGGGREEWIFPSARVYVLRRE